jgi:hypothetical protein
MLRIGIFVGDYWRGQPVEVWRSTPSPADAPVTLWTPRSTEPVRPASDDDEYLPELTLMEVIPARSDAEAVVQLGNWRHRVTSTAA